MISKKKRGLWISSTTEVRSKPDSGETDALVILRSLPNQVIKTLDSLMPFIFAQSRQRKLYQKRRGDGGGIGPRRCQIAASGSISDSGDMRLGHECVQYVQGRLIGNVG